ncbi:mucin-like protein [Styela clava]
MRFLLSVGMFIAYANVVWSLYDCPPPEKGVKSVETVSGREAVYECQPLYEPVSGNKYRYCMENGSWSGLPYKCKDAINCKEGDLPCQNGGKCVDTDPSLHCDCGKTVYYGSLCDQANGGWSSWTSTNNCSSTCDSGIIVRRRKCDNPKPTPRGMMCEGSSIETTECFPKKCHENLFRWCNTSADICEQNSNKAFCSARYEKYSCTCLAGVTEVKDEKGNFVRCEDVNECDAGTHTCDRQNGFCLNTDGSFKCQCNKGFKGDGHVCEDVDECNDGTNQCDENAICYNKPGGYNCVCKDGFRSISANQTGMTGDCKESRLMQYGYPAGDDEVTDISRATGERVTPLIPVPPGLPLEDGENAFTCETVYATENGVVVVTRLPSSADNDRKPTFRNPVDLKKENKQNVMGGEFHNYICAIMAPFWADAKFSKSSKMWRHVYDDLSWHGNRIKRGKVKKKELKKMHVYMRINKLLPEKFIPNFVVVVTWVRMIPPWPTKLNDEEVTYQIAVATDGTETHIITLYEDGAMTWKPVYDIPKDVDRYPATVGYIIFGEKINKHQYPYSEDVGNHWPNTTSIYHIDLIPFNATSTIGVDSYNLTLNASPGTKASCYNWYRENHGDIGSDVPSGSRKCPPSLDHLNLLRDILWKATIKEQDRQCFAWSFRVAQKGDIECCYRTTETYKDSPLISGIKAWDKGAGFFKTSDKAEADKKKLCCGDTKNEFFCSLFTRIRPATNSDDYTYPRAAFGKSGGATVNFGSKSTEISGTGQYQLLKIRTPSNGNIDFIGHYEDGVLKSLAFRYLNYTIKVDNNDKARGMSCILNTIDCESIDVFDNKVLFKTKPVASGLESVSLATRSGIYLNISSGENLKYTILIPSSMAATNTSFVSGLLTEQGKCYKNAKAEPFKKIMSIPCDLRSVASHFNTTVDREAFFTDEVDLTQEKKSQVRDVNDKTPEIKEAIEVTDSIKKPFPAKIQPVIEAKHVDSDNYNVQINITGFEDDVLLNGKNMKKSSNGLYTSKINNKETKSIGEISMTNKDGKTILVHRPIVVCDCKEKQGTCVFSSNEEENQSSIKSESKNAGCKCKEGFVGLRCEEVENPCSELPCFSRVECEEKQQLSPEAEEIDGVQLEKRYFCGQCPPSLEKGNGETCFNENKCLLPSDDPESHKCKNAKCVNQPSGYLCECLDGFRVSEDSNPYECIDVDECSIGKHECDKDVGVCVNIPGSYNCECKNGYITKLDSNRCEDVDECLDNNGGCERRCHNFIGSYKCSCELGYRLKPNGKNCSEINECDEHAKDVCEQICLEVEGQPFTCACHDRFTLMEDYRSCQPNFTTEAVTTRYDSTTTTVTTKQQETTTFARTETREQTTTAAAVTDSYDLLPDGWNFIDPNADSYTQLFQTLRRYFYLQMLDKSDFRNLLKKEKKEIQSFIEALAEILARSQTGRAIAYLLAVADQKMHKEWLNERDCLILAESVFHDSKLSVYLTALETFEGYLKIIKIILDEFNLKNIVRSLVIDFKLVNHLVSLSKKKIGRTGVDVGSNFKDTLGVKILSQAVGQIQHIHPCRTYIMKLMRTLPDTTTKPRKERSFVTDEGLTTQDTTLAEPILSKIYQPPAWLILCMVASALLVFILVVVVTRFCLTWKRQRKHRQKMKEMKKLKNRQKMKSWPRYVNTSQSYFDKQISKKLRVNP